MSKKYYLFHYFLFVICFAYCNFDLSNVRNKAYRLYLSSSPAIQGIDNPDDHVKIRIFKRTPAKIKRIAALESKIKLRIKSGFTGGGTNYDLPFVQSDAAPLLNDNSISAYYVSFNSLASVQTLKLRGPPSLLS